MARRHVHTDECYQEIAFHTVRDMAIRCVQQIGDSDVEDDDDRTKTTTTKDTNTTTTDSEGFSSTPQLINHRGNFERAGIAAPLQPKYSDSVIHRQQRNYNKYSRKPRSQRLNNVRPGTGSSGMSDIQWPGAGDFDIDVGKSKIREFIEKIWSYDDEILDYIIEYLYKAQLTKSRRYKYRVCWMGPPTERTSPGLDSATACVYFNIDVPNNADNYDIRDRKVAVSYTFQADKKLHKPGRSRFHEKWLEDFASGTLSMYDNAPVVAL